MCLLYTKDVHPSPSPSGGIGEVVLLLCSKVAGCGFPFLARGKIHGQSLLNLGTSFSDVYSSYDLRTQLTLCDNWGILRMCILLNTFALRSKCSRTKVKNISYWLWETEERLKKYRINRVRK